MYGNTSQGKSKDRILTAGSVTAFTLGLVIAFLLTPLFYNSTVGWMAGYADDAYLEGLGGFIRVIWGPIVALFTLTVCILTLTSGTRAGLLLLLRR